MPNFEDLIVHGEPILRRQIAEIAGDIKQIVTTLGIDVKLQSYGTDKEALDYTETIGEPFQTEQLVELRAAVNNLEAIFSGNCTYAQCCQGNQSNQTVSCQSNQTNQGGLSNQSQCNCDN